MAYSHNKNLKIKKTLKKLLTKGYANGILLKLSHGTSDDNKTSKPLVSSDWNEMNIDN